MSRSSLFPVAATQHSDVSRTRRRQANHLANPLLQPTQTYGFLAELHKDVNVFLVPASEPNLIVSRVKRRISALTLGFEELSTSVLDLLQNARGFSRRAKNLASPVLPRCKGSQEK